MLIASFVGCLVWIGYNELFVGGRTPESVEEISDWIKSVEYHGEPPVRILQIEPTWRPRSPRQEPPQEVRGAGISVLTPRSRRAAGFQYSTRLAAPSGAGLPGLPQ